MISITMISITISMMTSMIMMTGTTTTAMEAAISTTYRPARYDRASLLFLIGPLPAALNNHGNLTVRAGKSTAARS